MIAKLSASQIESFDPETTWGCPRKWWYERVGGRPQVKDAALTTGDAVHQTLETFLRGGDQGGLHDCVIQAPGALEYLIRLRKRLQFIERGFSAESLELSLVGIPIGGRIDWIASSGPVGGYELGDHKTTSNIAKYAKTVGQLKKSTQMNIYAKWLADNLGYFDELILSQDFYQTKGSKKFELVTGTITRAENDTAIDKVSCTIQDMVKVSAVLKPEDVAPNLAACNIGYGCPHRSYCPRSGEFNMASLLDAFKTPAAPIPVAVLPPDAPPSQPPAPIAEALKPRHLTIQDIEGSRPDLALEPALPDAQPGKGGRKPGSKNKPKEFDMPPNAVAVASFVPSMGPVTITKINIRHTVKVGMPNYGSAGVEVEMEGTVNGSLEEAKSSLSMQVQGAMVKELEVYTKAKAAVEGGKK